MLWSSQHRYIFLFRIEGASIRIVIGDVGIVRDPCGVRTVQGAKRGKAWKSWGNFVVIFVPLDEVTSCSHFFLWLFYFSLGCFRIYGRTSPHQMLQERSFVFLILICYLLLFSLKDVYNCYLVYNICIDIFSAKLVESIYYST